MGCTIYAASPKALPADEAPGQDRYYPVPHYRHPHGNCSQRIAASRARSVNSTQEVFLDGYTFKNASHPCIHYKKKKKITVLNSSRKSVFNLGVFLFCFETWMAEEKQGWRDHHKCVSSSSYDMSMRSQLVITDTTKCVIQGLFVQHCQLKTT